MTLESKQGRVFLVGAGPGDPALVTLKAVECLRHAEVIIYDYLANEELLEFAPREAEQIYVGKKAGSHAMSQEQINELLVEKGRNAVVVRLKGGDPFIFGRGGEEALVLEEAGIEFQVVPGVTSAIAVPAYAGIPLTHRGLSSSVAFVTGHEMEGKDSSAIHWDRLATGVGTLVFLMGVKNLEYIASQLVAFGRAAETPTAVIRWGTAAAQTTVTGTLGNIARVAKAAGIKPPAIIVVGEVVGLRRQLNWFEERPLFGKTIVVTRAREQASDFRTLLEESGARCLEFPTIEVGSPASWEPLDKAIGQLEDYDWMIFTSVNGVRFFFKRVEELGEDVRLLRGIRLGAIGPKTAAGLRERGLRIDLVPSEYRAEAVIEALAESEVRGKRFLLPRAAKAREILPEKLVEMGGLVDVVPAYETVRPPGRAGEVRSLLQGGDIACVTFTSSSTVENFGAMFPGDDLPTLVANAAIACIGPITAETASRHGLKVDIMPAEYTIDALAAEIVEYFGRE
ncbi:MAG: uroporphyrinogen-III C-methyltransferase [Deltaproteobacteria bacterium]|nr:MAG: uroporphyrinogen-III C-methyltransferase [Deltaproteobacteria bacterium]